MLRIGYLQEKDLLLRQDTIVDATIIRAPCLTRNEKEKRDPEMHQIKKGDQYQFGRVACLPRKTGRKRTQRTLHHSTFSK